MSEKENHTIYVKIAKMYEVKLESTIEVAEEIEQHLGDYLGNDGDIDSYPRQQSLPLDVKIEECCRSADWETEIQTF